jgi:general secretion pathway protein D
MKRFVLILALALGAAACATLSDDYQQGSRTLNQEYRMGVRAELNRDYEKAAAYYEKAALAKPREPVYRLALMRARAAASLINLQLARSLAAVGEKEAAVTAYKKALSYDPANRALAEELRAFQEPAPKPERAAQEKLEGPVTLKSTGEPLNLSFRTEVSLRSIFQTLGRVAGVNFIYDETYRDTSLAIDLTGKDLQSALSFLCVASKNFFRVIDERTVIIVPDNVQKRMQYELNAIRTFYLSNINAQDVQQALVQMVKTMYKVPSIQVDKNLNSVTIRDTPQAVALAEKLLKMWDKAKGEVLIDIEIMEVSRLRLQELGIDLSQGNLGVQLNPLEGGTTDGWFRVEGLDFSDIANYQVTIPSAYLKFIGADSDTKIIAQPRIRGIAGEKIEYVVGQKVPIPQTSFYPVAAGGQNSQPLVSYQPTDVGISIKMTPRIHLEREVTMEIELQISSVSGEGIAGIPIIATREVKNTIRLKDGETNLLAGLLRDEERRSLKGIVGLKDIPLIGNLFSSTQTTIEQYDVVLTITPHIIRAMNLTDEDTRALWVDPDSLAGVTGAGQRPAGQEMFGEPERPENVRLEPERAGGANSVFLSPASFEAPRDREFRVNVELVSEGEIGSMSLGLTFDPGVLQLKDVVEGGVIKQLGQRTPFLKSVSGGGATLGFTSPSGTRGFRGRGILAVLVFTAVAPGETAVSITSYSAAGPGGQPVVLDSGGSTILIR